MAVLVAVSGAETSTRRRLFESNDAPVTAPGWDRGLGGSAEGRDTPALPLLEAADDEDAAVWVAILCWAWARSPAISPSAGPLPLEDANCTVASANGSAKDISACCSGDTETMVLPA